MIKHLFTLGFICICMIANAQVGVGTTDPKATLEVRKSTTTPTTAIDGIIAPNITKLELASKVGATYGIAQTGAIVYVTTINTVASEPSVTQVANINTIGYYYFDGTVWQSLKPVEPWNLANSSTSATSNTQNIYQSGRIGLNSATIAGNTDYFKTHDAVRAIEIIGDGNESDDILIRSFSSAGSATGQLFQQASRGTATSPAPVQNGDGVGTLTFAANGAASGVAFVEAANIKAVVGPTGTISSTSVPMDLAFSTGIANNPTETMRISSAGNVGIKTPTPNATLDVKKSTTTPTTSVDGIIPPNMTKTELANKVASTYAAAQTGAIVYVSDASGGTTGTSLSQVANINATGYYFFDGTALVWKKIDTDTNLYTIDGALAGNRTVTQAGNTLAFTGTAVNAFSVDGTTFSVDAANNRVGIGTVTPNANAILDLTSTTKGLLLPRVSLIALNNASPLSAHTAGMEVYNTNTPASQVAGQEVYPGKYYNDGAKWVREKSPSDTKLIGGGDGADFLVTRPVSTINTSSIEVKLFATDISIVVTTPIYLDLRANFSYRLGSNSTLTTPITDGRSRMVYGTWKFTAVPTGASVAIGNEYGTSTNQFSNNGVYPTGTGTALSGNFYITPNFYVLLRTPGTYTFNLSAFVIATGGPYFAQLGIDNDVYSIVTTPAW